MNQGVFEFLGLAALVGIALALSVAARNDHEADARTLLQQAGYDTTNMKHEFFGCMSGKGYTRDAFVVPVENGAKVKICVGGWLAPKITVVP